MAKPIFLLSTVLLSFLASAAGSPPKPSATRQGRNSGEASRYYILPLRRGSGGGLTLAARKGRCPLYVAQEIFEVARGLPVTFRPVDPKDAVVRLSTDQNVEFAAATVCAQSTVWKLGDLDGSTKRSNWFKIERSGMDYKLVFCPTVCKFCKVLCGDVGVFYENGRRYLGLSAQPFPVMFKKA
ncbi:unnamed protein product [Spirodela intermedia]|uniref:Uncharacterized protein n=1 Tax=Spirodela intermedia TaxID=51605 RepID=A0A7I8IYP5_SPIIN|nr:unnamed protein product [Spirodela intermedia]CAA6662693.1 unnamed protein product [Spirodela intermedia]